MDPNTHAPDQPNQPQPPTTQTPAPAPAVHLQPIAPQTHAVQAPFIAPQQQRYDPSLPLSAQIPQSKPPAKPLIRNPIMYYMGPESLKKRIIGIGGTLIAFGVLIACVILLVGLFRQPAKYHDLQSIAVQDVGSVTDGTYTVSIPKEFVLDGKDADSMMYVHMSSKNADATVLGRLSATGVYVGEAANVADLKAELANQAVAQKGAVYEGFIVDHTKAVLSDLEGELTFDPFAEGVATGDKPLLQSNFTFKKLDGTMFSGRIIVVFGIKHMYILTAVSEEDRWTSNEAVWNQVFDSFTVDTKSTT